MHFLTSHHGFFWSLNDAFGCCFLAYRCAFPVVCRRAETYFVSGGIASDFANVAGGDCSACIHFYR